MPSPELHGRDEWWIYNTNNKEIRCVEYRIVKINTCMQVGMYVCRPEVHLPFCGLILK